MPCHFMTLVFYSCLLHHLRIQLTDLFFQNPGVRYHFRAINLLIRTTTSHHHYLIQMELTSRSSELCRSLNHTSLPFLDSFVHLIFFAKLNQVQNWIPLQSLVQGMKRDWGRVPRFPKSRHLLAVPNLHYSVLLTCLLFLLPFIPQKTQMFADHCQSYLYSGAGN